MRNPAWLTLTLLASFGCDSKPPAAPVAPAAETKPAPRPVSYDQLNRLDFNRRAAEKFLPIFWRDDANQNGILEPAELASLWGFGHSALADWVGPGGFTPKFVAAYATLTTPDDWSKLPPDEKKRRETVALELSQGRQTLLETRFEKPTDEDRAIVQHVLKAAELVERLHSRQNGTLGLDEKIPADDAASRMMFYRNQSPFCVAPKTENDAACTALWPKPARVVGLYPPEVQTDPKFCEALSKQPNAKELMDHFSVVAAGDKPGTFKAVPYAQAWPEDMQAVATELDAAAAAITSPGEAAFKAYLTAAAAAFRTNDWESANGPWAAMGVGNSKWYLRIAPDEVYYEPCAWKAGFAVSFAHINPDSIAWQQKLDPVKGEMEKTLAAMAGAPYKARKVAFKLPDFIDMIANAGDARDPHGATAGQSLPNWGPVAEKGGRTVTMTNLYLDADSRAALQGQLASLLCPATNQLATTDGVTPLASVVLHEAAHNLGPAHDYKVKGKEDDVVFGGPLASTLEELKAQTSALFFSDWLVEKKLLTQDEANKMHVREIGWAFGHVSRGMYAGNGSPKNYSQLAAIQLGTLNQASVLQWKPSEKAANGVDVGCFEADLPKFAATIKTLETRVLKIKARGDKADAEKLKSQFVDEPGAWADLRAIITERWLRAPKASFVYSVSM